MATTKSSPEESTPDPSVTEAKSGTNTQSTSTSGTAESSTAKSSATKSTSAKSDAAAPRKHGFAHKLYSGEMSYDFIGRRRLWYVVSLALILFSVLGLVVRGLNLGVEFTGGSTFTVSVKQAGEKVDLARQHVEASGVPELNDIQVVAVGDGQLRVQTRSLDTDELGKVRTSLAKGFGVPETAVSTSTIGKSWGSQITQKGLQGLAIFLVLVMLLIWAYFRDWKMSIAAIVALIHDLIITVGVYSWTGFTATPASLIGLLTILGYSLYDNVVVFDKVRENTRNMTAQNRTYAQAANLAVNQVLVRSINTTIIGVLPVAALLFAGTFVLGQGPLEDLGLALFVGMIVGAYSSIFIATPLLVEFREREPAMIEHAKHVEKKATKPAPATRSKVKVSTVVQPETTLAGPAAEGDTDVDEVEVVEDDSSAPDAGDEPTARRQPNKSSRSARRK